MTRFAAYASTDPAPPDGQAHDNEMNLMPVYGPCRPCYCAVILVSQPPQLGAGSSDSRRCMHPGAPVSQIGSDGLYVRRICPALMQSWASWT